MIATQTQRLVDELRQQPVAGPRTGIQDQRSIPDRASEAPHVLSIEARLAAQRLEARGDSRLTNDARNALAAAYIEQGEFSRAIALLEPAVRANPQSTSLSATLTAALSRREAPGDRIRAFDRAQSILRFGESDAITLFNAAITAQSVLPTDRVRLAWERYVAVERDPRWKAFAAAKVQQLAVHASSETSVDSVRAEILEEALPAWAEACATSAVDEPISRSRVQQLAAKTSAGSDELYPDLVSYLANPRGGNCRADVARMVQLSMRGRALYARDELSEAGTVFEEIARSNVGSAPLVLQARLFAATAAYFGGRRDRAVLEFDAIRDEARQRQYLELLGRAEWMRGYAKEDRSEFEGAVRAYEAALDAYSKAASLDGIASAHNLLSGALDWLGQYEGAWRHRESSLASLWSMRDSRARSSILTGLIRASARDGLLTTALAWMDLKLAEDAVVRSPVRHAQALIERAELQSAALLPDAARESFAHAEASLKQVSIGAAKARLEAQLLSGRAVAESDPARAIALLTQAIDSYKTSGSDVALARLLLFRARAFVRASNRASAETDLRRGIEIVERARSTVQTAAFRLTYFDDVWDLFDEFLDLAVDRGDLMQALDIAERARGRVLRETMSAGESGSSAMGLPSGSGDVLVFYLSLRTRLIVWIISNGTPNAVVRHISRSDLVAKVRDFSACVATSKSDACDSGPLADVLLTPLRQHTQGATRLTIVPDPVLESLPFAALRNPSTNRLLLEDFALALAPSLRSRRAVRARPVANRNALLIGNPAIAERLPSLTGAANEARGIASLYGDAVLHIGVEATRAAFLRDLPGADVVHFAGHAIADPEVPDFARLLLAPGPEGRGTLYAHELDRLRLARHPVVVLAACETAIGRTSRSEGMISLARSFMSAGAREVIATLWRIEDAASTPLFLRLHDALRTGKSGADALRSAQLEMLRSSDPQLRRPAAWASTVAWVSLDEQSRER
jgi:CHAT domain-containing protein